MANVELSAVASTSFAATASLTVTRPRITKISISGFRAFPPGSPNSFEINLEDDGKNLLLFGENGSGKSSLFKALRELCDTGTSDKPFSSHQNIFEQRDDDSIVLELTTLASGDYRWQVGDEHPKETQGDPFREFAKSCLFLDYRDLLQTNFTHRNGSPNIYDLLVDVILPETRIGTRTLSGLNRAMLTAKPSNHHGNRKIRWAKEAAENLRNALTDNLPEVQDHANAMLSKLQKGTVIRLSPPEYLDYSVPLRAFVGREIKLTVFYHNQEITEPQHFLNEARLTAIALAVYLAGARISRSNRPGIMVLDDVLIGLDISNRIPLLQLLQSEFGEWQIFLFTHDRSWFELAEEQTASTDWAYEEMYARLMPSGREYPAQERHTSYLDRAWNALQNNDYKASGVYLRCAFERILKDFCIERSLLIPVKRELRNYKSEDFWPLVRNYKVKDNHKLLDEGLIAEINLARRYVLNPLCHDDPTRPNREETRRTHASLERLKVLLDQDLSWRKKLDDRLRDATRDILGDNEDRTKRALKGLAPATEFALASACKLLANPAPPLAEAAGLLRAAFDRMLWEYCKRKNLNFQIRCDEELSTRRLWEAAKEGATGLSAARLSFVEAVDQQSALLLSDSPTRDVCSALEKDSLESLCELLAGSSWKTNGNPRPSMSNF